jgi:hypothetical protein
MLAAAGLAEALRGMGRYPEARALDEASFAWRRNALGSDHPETLIAAHDLAVDLRKLSEVEASRDPLRDTLTRRRSVLGEDDPETLATAGNLGVTLRDLGDLGEARSLHEDADLYDLGELDAVRELDEDTLARKRHVLGQDHPDTRRAAHNVMNIAVALTGPHDSLDCHTAGHDRLADDSMAEDGEC